MTTGWIKHDGSKCPLPYGTLINVRLGDGLGDDKPCFAGFWGDWWSRKIGSRRIAYYRIVEPTLEAQK